MEKVDKSDRIRKVRDGLIIALLAVIPVRKALLVEDNCLTVDQARLDLEQRERHHNGRQGSVPGSRPARPRPGLDHPAIPAKFGSRQTGNSQSR